MLLFSFRYNASLLISVQCFSSHFGTMLLFSFRYNASLLIWVQCFSSHSTLNDSYRRQVFYPFIVVYRVHTCLSWRLSDKRWATVIGSILSLDSSLLPVVSTVGYKNFIFFATVRRYVIDMCQCHFADAIIRR